MGGQDGAVEPGGAHAGGAMIEDRLQPAQLGGVQGGLRLEHARQVGLPRLVAGALPFVRFTLEAEGRGRGDDAGPGGLEIAPDGAGGEHQGLADVREAQLRLALRASGDAEVRGVLAGAERDPVGERDRVGPPAAVAVIIEPPLRPSAGSPKLAPDKVRSRRAWSFWSACSRFASAWASWASWIAVAKSKDATVRTHGAKSPTGGVVAGTSGGTAIATCTSSTVPRPSSRRRAISAPSTDWVAVSTATR